DKFRWSSYPAYRQPNLRCAWLPLDRLLGEHGLEKDTARNRREFERRTKMARLEPGENESVRRGWRSGAEDFHDWRADKLARRGRKGERARERSETDAALAEKIVLGALAKARWREIDLRKQPNGPPVKVRIGPPLPMQTPMNRQWIADRLRMGSPSYVSNLLASVDSKLSPPDLTPGSSSCAAPGKLAGDQ